MATMYYLLLGFLLIAVCNFKGNGGSFLDSNLHFHPSFSMTGTYFFFAKKYAKTSSLKPQSALRSKTFDTMVVPLTAIVKNLPSVSSQARFVGDTESECRDNDSFNSKLEKDNLQNVILTLHYPRAIERAGACISLQTRLMSPVKILTIAGGGTNVPSECSSDELWPLLRSKVERPSGMEDKRIKIISIASAELGVREATNNNDGPRVEEYLRYTNLGPGFEWCAAFVSWCYGQAGLAAPRNPWSPALFPKKRWVPKGGVQPADVFGIYSASAKRINHVGLIKDRQGPYLITIEGNSNNRVESRRRHDKTIHAIAGWL